jgi:hypothetical protein
VDRRRASTLLSTRLFNPLVKIATNAGLPVPGIAILETTGRKTGWLRRTPVGRSLDGNTFWIVAEHGSQRQLRAQPLGKPERPDQDRPPLAHRNRRT